MKCFSYDTEHELKVIFNIHVYMKLFCNTDLKNDNLTNILFSAFLNPV